MPKQRAILEFSSFTVRPTKNELPLRTEDSHTEDGRVRLVSITRQAQLGMPGTVYAGGRINPSTTAETREMNMEEFLGTHRPADLLYLRKHEILTDRK